MKCVRLNDRWGHLLMGVTHASDTGAAVSALSLRMRKGPECLRTKIVAACYINNKPSAEFRAMIIA